MSISSEIRARHIEASNPTYASHCRHCGQPWPCDAIRAADEIDRQDMLIGELTGSLRLHVPADCRSCAELLGREGKE